MEVVWARSRGSACGRFWGEEQRGPLDVESAIVVGRNIRQRSSHPPGQSEEISQDSIRFRVINTSKYRLRDWGAASIIVVFPIVHIVDSDRAVSVAILFVLLSDSFESVSNRLPIRAIR